MYQRVYVDDIAKANESKESCFRAGFGYLNKFRYMFFFFLCVHVVYITHKAFDKISHSVVEIIKIDLCISLSGTRFQTLAPAGLETGVQHDVNVQHQLESSTIIDLNFELIACSIIDQRVFGLYVCERDF